MREAGPADEYWRAAADVLSPEKSLARIDDKAKQLVGGVGLVGAILGSSGLVASGRLPVDGTARLLVVVSSVLAFVAVAVALAASLLRFERSFPHRNLVAVRAWYERQFRRAQLVLIGGGLLLLAVVIAAMAVATDAASSHPHNPSLVMTAVPSGSESVVSATVDASDLEPASLISIELAATPVGGRMVLARGAARADSRGKAAISFNVKAPANTALELVADARRHCVLRLSGAGAPVQSQCTPL